MCSHALYLVPVKNTDDITLPKIIILNFSNKG
jgi:hypothetical protein